MSSERDYSDIIKQRLELLNISARSPQPISEEQFKLLGAALVDNNIEARKKLNASGLDMSIIEAISSIEDEFANELAALERHNELEDEQREYAIDFKANTTIKENNAVETAINSDNFHMPSALFAEASSSIVQPETHNAIEDNSTENNTAYILAPSDISNPINVTVATTEADTSFNNGESTFHDSNPVSVADDSGVVQFSGATETANNNDTDELSILDENEELELDYDEDAPSLVIASPRDRGAHSPDSDVFDSIEIAEQNSLLDASSNEMEMLSSDASPTRAAPRVVSMFGADLPPPTSLPTSIDAIDTRERARARAPNPTDDQAENAQHNDDDDVVFLDAFVLVDYLNLNELVEIDDDDEDDGKNDAGRADAIADRSQPIFARHNFAKRQKNDVRPMGGTTRRSPVLPPPAVSPKAADGRQFAPRSNSDARNFKRFRGDGSDSNWNAGNNRQSGGRSLSCGPPTRGFGRCANIVAPSFLNRSSTRGTRRAFSRPRDGASDVPPVHHRQSSSVPRGLRHRRSRSVFGYRQYRGGYETDSGSCGRGFKSDYFTSHVYRNSSPRRRLENGHGQLRERSRPPAESGDYAPRGMAQNGFSQMRNQANSRYSNAPPNRMSNVQRSMTLFNSRKRKLEREANIEINLGDNNPLYRFCASPPLQRARNNRNVSSYGCVMQPPFDAHRKQSRAVAYACAMMRARNSRVDDAPLSPLRKDNFRSSRDVPGPSRMDSPIRHTRSSHSRCHRTRSASSSSSTSMLYSSCASYEPSASSSAYSSFSSGASPPVNLLKSKLAALIGDKRATSVYNRTQRQQSQRRRRHDLRHSRHDERRERHRRSRSRSRSRRSRSRRHRHHHHRHHHDRRNRRSCSHRPHRNSHRHDDDRDERITTSKAELRAIISEAIQSKSQPNNFSHSQPPTNMGNASAGLPLPPSLFPFPPPPPGPFSSNVYPFK